MQERAVLGAQLLEHVLADRGQAHEHRAPVARIGDPLDPSALLEAVDEQRDRRLGHALLRRQLGDPPRPGAQIAQHPDLGAGHAHARPGQEQPRQRRRALGQRLRDLVELAAAAIYAGGLHQPLILPANATSPRPRPGDREYLAIRPALAAECGERSRRGDRIVRSAPARRSSRLSSSGSGRVGRSGPLMGVRGGPDAPLAEIARGQQRVVGAQALGAVAGHELAVRQHVAAVSDLERQVDVLLDQQHRGPVGRGELPHHGQQALDDHRREAEAELVEQQQPRAPAERPRDREHLLLAAGQQPRPPAAAGRATRGNERTPRPSRAPRAAPSSRKCSAHRQPVEDPPPLGHVNDAPADARGRRDAGEVAPSSRTRAAHRLDQPRDRSQRRRLAGAVGPDQRHDLAGSHRQRQVAHHGRAVIPGAQLLELEGGGVRDRLVSGARTLPSHRRSRSRDPPHRCRSSRAAGQVSLPPRPRVTQLERPARRRHRRHVLGRRRRRIRPPAAGGRAGTRAASTRRPGGTAG